MAKKSEEPVRLDALQKSDVFAAIKKKFGASIITKASEAKVQVVPRIPAGIFQLDYALGGGWPVGRVNIIYGMKQTSKTTLTSLAISQAQKICGRCYTPQTYHVDEDTGEVSCKCGNWRDMSIAYLDVEGTYDIQWGAALGVDHEKMLLSRPDNAEQALDIAEALIRSKECDVIVLDSLAFLTPLAEIQESTSKDLVGTQARTLGKGVRKFVSALNWVENSEEGWKPTIFLTNQIRMKVGLLFGNPETQPGGLAPGFAASSEVKLFGNQYEMDKESGRPLHVDIKFRVEKNKVGCPRMEGVYRLILTDAEYKKMGQVYDENFLIQQAARLELLTGGGSSWTLMDRKFGSKKAVEEELVKNKAFSAEIRQVLMEVLTAA